MSKRCSRCEALKDESEYHSDARTKDQLQAYCKVCKAERQKERQAGKITPREVVRQHKILRVARSLVEHNGNQTQAYMSLGTTKDKDVASASVSRFVNNMTDNDCKLFRNMLTPPKILNHVAMFFEDVLCGKVETTIDEKCRVLDRWGKFAGTYAPEVVQSISKATSEETRRSMLEDVSNLLEKEDKEDENAVHQTEVGKV